MDQPRTSRRKTPRSRNPFYTRTPKSRHILTRSSVWPNTRHITDLAEEIVMKSWTMYKLSPMNGFTFGTNAMKTLARKLNLFIKTDRRARLDPDNEAGCFQVSANVIGDIHPRDGFYFMAIQISIQILDGRSKSNTAASKNATVILLRIGNEIDDCLGAGFVWIPLLICRGPVDMTTRVLNFLMLQFDCRISLLKLPSGEIAWISAMWAGSREAVKPCTLHLVYNVPKKIKGIQKVTISVAAKDIQDLWASIHNVDSGELLHEEVEAFHKSLEAHIFKYFRIKLSGLQLTEASSSTIRVNNTGKIKVQKAKCSSS